MVINLNQNVKDSITGFEGKVTGKSQYLFGLNRIQITPMSLKSDGSPIPAEWFDEGRIEEVKTKEPLGLNPNL